MTDNNLSVEVFGDLVETGESLDLTPAQLESVKLAETELRKQDYNDLAAARKRGEVYFNLKTELGHGTFGRVIEQWRHTWWETQGQQGLKWSQKSAENYMKLHEIYVRSDDPNDPLFGVWKSYIRDRNLGTTDAYHFCAGLLDGADPDEMYRLAFAKPAQLGDGASCIIDPTYPAMQALVDAERVHPELACKIIAKCNELGDSRLQWAGQHYGFGSVEAVQAFNKMLESGDKARSQGFEVNDLLYELTNTNGHIEKADGDQVELWAARHDDIWDAYAKVRKEKGAQNPKRVKIVNSDGIRFDIVKQIIDLMDDPDLANKLENTPQNIVFSITISRPRVNGEA